MEGIMKRILSLILCFSLIAAPVLASSPADISSAIVSTGTAATTSTPTPSNSYNSALAGTAKSAILIEQTTGQVLYESNADEKLPIASVTKVMTMLLAMEALNNGTITMDTMLTCSAYAASMGGSQVYLEPGEQMSFSDALKAVAVASGNDAAVMIAEKLAGSEGEFVKEMNNEAARLSLKNTNFVNCNGLDEDGGSGYSSARDVSIISAELLKYPQILPFLSIWMDSLRNGQFTLANTNKLIHSYDGANGIKTGSTAAAGYCLSASALKDGMQLIAVVLGAPSTADRFSIATNLLDYGFANYATVPVDISNTTVKVEKGSATTINAVPKTATNLVVPKAKKSQVTSEINLPKSIAAPINKSDKVGNITYKIGDQQIAEIDLISDSNVSRMNWWQSFMRSLKGLV